MIPPFNESGYLPPGIHPATLEPNDVDCVLLIADDFPRDEQAEAELAAGLPFLELSLVNQADFDLLVNEIFSTDRRSVTKGMVEIITWV